MIIQINKVKSNNQKENSMKILKHLLSIGLLILVLINLSCQQQQAPVEKPKDGVFVHISHGTDDPHRALMGLQMAAIMAESKDVLVYIDITGVDLVLKDSKDLTFSHFPSSLTQLTKLIDMGITVYVCPGCLKAAGKTPEDVMNGVKIADKEGFFNFTKGRILAIDY
jgi:predicted peroxiredoxin